MPPRARKALRRIYWAAERGSALIPVLQSLPEFAHCQHEVLDVDFTGGRAYFEKSQVRLAAMHPLANVEDWSIRVQFPRIKTGALKYQGCPFLKTKLADISGVDLPREYYVVQGMTPGNDSASRGYRDLLPFEWNRLIRRCRQTGIPAVVLDLPGETLPQDDQIQDRRGLSLAEGIEVLKDPRAVGYIGIDSWLSIMACHRFDDPRRLIIRSRNRHWYDWMCAYCAPHTEVTFGVEEIP